MRAVHYPTQYHYAMQPPTPAAQFLDLPSLSPVAGSYGASHIPLPAMSCKSHPVLAPTPHGSFTFNLTLPVENLYDPRSRFPTQELPKPATYPALPKLIITLIDMPKWQIHVVPSTTAYITVHDVLFALYTQLRIPVSDGECARAFADHLGADRGSVRDAFYRRLEAMPEPYRLAEQKKGIKRADFLGSKIHFAGLSPKSPRSPDEWVLLVS
ncbi:hypothetical protein BDZ89DRAFT_1079661 [Hymenopellis radicata]|nr:hypothetical protein BDZ89DRAFT_1079661 [Hymenopellis radicata]